MDNMIILPRTYATVPINHLNHNHMNKTQIGENAGIVWNILKDNNHWEYEQLKEISGLSDRELNAAIGWLAREDKIDFDMNQEGDRIFLTVNVFIG